MVYCRQQNMSTGQWDPSKYHSWPPDASTRDIEGVYGGYGVGVHLTNDQPDPQADDMSC